MTEKKQKELLYKILLLGDSSVGKTCFLMRYSDNTFQEIHMSTIGLDYKLKNVQLDDGKIVGKGTHEELMENCETYRQNALSQLSREELDRHHIQEGSEEQ